MSNYSKKSIKWLKFKEIQYNAKIVHAENKGEYNIPDTNYKADGYMKKNNTIFEFHGDMWHGNPLVFELNDKNPVNGDKYYDLYIKTIKKKKEITDMGYNYEEIWENTWDNCIKIMNDFKKNRKIREIKYDYSKLKLTNKKIKSIVPYKKISFIGYYSDNLEPQKLKIYYKNKGKIKLAIILTRLEIIYTKKDKIKTFDPLNHKLLSELYSCRNYFFEIKIINNKKKYFKDKQCKKCGKNYKTDRNYKNHKCYKEKNINRRNGVRYHENNWHELNYKNKCYRCGRKGHFSNKCYASKHIKGYYL